MIKPVALLFSLSALASSGASAINVGANEGVRISQTSHVVDTTTIENTRIGRFEVDLNKLRAAVGPAPGYLNMATNNGWVVKNLPVLPEEAFPYSKVSTTFDLNVVEGIKVTSIDAAIDFSPTVLQSPPGTFFGHSVGGVINVLGRTGDTPVTGTPSPPNLSNIVQFQGTDNLSTVIGDFPNIDALRNQSLTLMYGNIMVGMQDGELRSAYGQHKPGRSPSVSPGDNSVVGAIEQSTDINPGLRGLLDFTARFSPGELRPAFSHYGTFGPDSGASSISRTVNGVTATSTGRGTSIVFDNIYSSVFEGQGCGMVYGWPTGAHAVSILAAGKTRGQPWIIHASDQNQSSDQLGAGPAGIEFAYLHDTDGNGRLNLNGTNSEVLQLICARYVPNESIVTLLKTIDPAGHSCCVEPVPPRVRISRSSFYFPDAFMYVGADASTSYLPMSGTQASDGTFDLGSIGTVAGFSNVRSEFKGKCTNGTCEGRLSVGIGGELPGKQPISWDIRVVEPEQPLRPAMRVNGFRAQVGSFSAADPLKISVSLRPLHKTGTSGDWWLAARAPDSSFYHFDLGSFGWKPGLAPTYTGPLFDLPYFGLPMLSGVPPGAYSFYFGFDSTPNGVIDGNVVYEETRFNLTTPPPPPAP